MRRFARLVLLCFAVSIGSLIAGCASPLLKSPLLKSPLATYEHSHVYYPSKFPEGNWHPEDLQFEDARFTAEDGTKLHGWFVPHENPRAVVLFAHGNAGNITHREESLRILNERHGLAVLAFDYRGYGRSEGIPDEAGLLQDARAARKWLAERTGIEEQEVVVMGRSLGGGVAVDLAANDGARGLVLASTFTTLPAVANHHAGGIPAGVVMKNRFDSAKKIARYDGPLLQSHGDSDEVIPYKLGRRLFEQAPGPKRFVAITGGRHNSPQSEEYRRAFDEFIDALP
ncbi:MAG: alpha/beta hydrolase [Planctomycetaceae bacterium]|jgi:uncharacterized protein|nr:alpha/beta hydrolase [Planctomycetaceae bacterium]MBT6157075.1 alpha/beta hydrolase [Planctomycetaceae bacterium]MBT6484359.1 alpha/beta hydrolase [Planctomycetaceae bacterium]MBT6498092.1 alpha/beta hydrolase [Planctomycetaceae bacterium]